MSRSIKKKIKIVSFKNKHKLKPYAPKGSWKFTPDQHEYLPGTYKRISKKAKLDAKNANRSLKKTVRQQSKKEIQNYED